MRIFINVIPAAVRYGQNGKAKTVHVFGKNEMCNKGTVCTVQNQAEALFTNSSSSPLSSVSTGTVQCRLALALFYYQIEKC